MYKHKYAVVIGRFQPFHVGHLALVEKALEVADKVVIVVGSSYASRNVKNPFTFAERKRMILDSVEERFGDSSRYRFTVVGLRDYHYSEALWVTDLANAVNNATGGSPDVVLVGHKKDSSSYYLDLFSHWKYVEHTHPTLIEESDVLGATDIRRWMFQGRHPRWGRQVPRGTARVLTNFVQSETFNELKAEYEYLLDYPAQWGPGPFLTTDAVVFQNGHVLVVQRGEIPGKGLLALPGGFLNLNERLIDGAMRELQEETGLVVTPNQLADKEVFDYPQRSSRGRIVTHAFNFVLDGTTQKLSPVKGADDAAWAFWMPIYEAMASEERFYEDHLAIIRYFAMRVRA